MNDLLKILTNAYLNGEYCGQPPEVTDEGIVVWLTTDSGETKIVVRTE